MVPLLVKQKTQVEGHSNFGHLGTLRILGTLATFNFWPHWILGTFRFWLQWDFEDIGDIADIQISAISGLWAYQGYWGGYLGHSNFAHIGTLAILRKLGTFRFGHHWEYSQHSDLDFNGTWGTLGILWGHSNFGHIGTLRTLVILGTFKFQP